MVELKELEWKKRNELYNGIARLGIPIEKAKKIFESLEDEGIIDITAPKREELVLQMVTIQAAHTGRVSGKSYKPGNIFLNLKKAPMNAVIFSTSTAASIGAVSMDQPWITAFTILTAVLTAANLGKIELDDNAVLILAVL